MLTAHAQSFLHSVLIESDWNLKVTATADGVIVVLVLIESDWNLKLLVQNLR